MGRRAGELLFLVESCLADRSVSAIGFWDKEKSKFRKRNEVVYVEHGLWVRGMVMEDRK